MYRNFCESLMVEIEENERINKHYANVYMDFPGGSVVKSLPAETEDMGSIPGLERSPGEGNGKPFQYSCLRNLLDRGAWWVLGVTRKLDTT